MKETSSSQMVMNLQLQQAKAEGAGKIKMQSHYGVFVF